MATRSQSCLPDQVAQAGVRCRHPLERHLLQSGPAYSNPGQTEIDGATILVCSKCYLMTKFGSMEEDLS